MKRSWLRKKQNDVIPEGVIPAHIAIIPDGNRRWAKERRLPAVAGHKEGAEAFRRVVRRAGQIGVRYITFYAFSTENWTRNPDEVSSLMKLLLNFLQNYEKELGEDRNKLRICVIGDRSALTEQLQKEIERVEAATFVNRELIVNIALNYGSRDELLQGIRKIAEKVQKGELAPRDIREDTVENSLFTAGIPDPDLLIRTSGEERISNFLLWQMAYTEMYFPKMYWPEFGEKELDEAVAVFGKRQRRFGGDNQ